MVKGAFLTVTLDPKSIETIERLVGSLQQGSLFAKVDQLFFAQAPLAARHVVATMLSGQRLARRTGQLSRSIQGVATRIDGLPSLQVGVFRGPALRYAGVQEFGTRGLNPESPFATIVPKTARALAIPTEKVTGSSGVDRFGGPRGYPGELRFIPFRSSGVAVGGLFDAEELDRGGFQSARAAYILVRKVDIPPKFYMRDGFNSYLPTIANELADLLVDIVSGRAA